MSKETIHGDITLSWSKKCSCYSFNLPARVSCPGVKERMKDPKAICNFCYAAASCWQFKKPKETIYRNLKFVTSHNTKEILDAFLCALIKVPVPQREYFRFFGSGDWVNDQLGVVTLDIANLFPETKFWVPTQNLENFVKYGPFAPKNLTVRLTAMRINDPAPEFGMTTFTDTPLPRHYVCPGECEGCRVCWNSPKTRVAFKMHGSAVTMAKLKKARQLGKW